MDHSRESEKLKAIAHPVRLRMVEGLLKNECCVKNMVEKMGLPQSTVSQHLGVLRRAGIISPRKKGVMTCYKVIDGTIIELFRILTNR